MHGLISHLYKIRDVCYKSNVKFQYSHGIPANQMPIAALNMAGNKITLAIELLDYYAQVFSKPVSGTIEYNVKLFPEQGGRLVELLNNCFVGVLSCFESCARKASLRIKGIFGPEPKYLVNVVQKSKKLGWISHGDALIWENLIKIRNFLVHNNGESRGISDFVLPGGYIWKFRPGVQSRVTLRHITASIEWLVDAYIRLCDSFLAAWAVAFDYRPDWNRPLTYEVENDKIRIPVYGFDFWSKSGSWSWGELVKDIR